MIILGIDPGTRRMGFGLVSASGNRVDYLSAGVIPVKSSGEKNELGEIALEIESLIGHWRPSLLAIEKLYFSNNQKTALAVAQARGVVLAAAARSGLPIVELIPNEIKLGLTGYGHADKKGVMKMVSLVLGKKDLKLLDDASDALAAAICAAQNLRLR